MSIKMSSFNDNTSLLEETKRETKKPSHVKVQVEEERVKIIKRSSDSHSIVQRIKDAPIVDKDKVNAFKQKLANNSFMINAQSIADKLLSLESDIFPPLSTKTEK